MRKYYRGFRLWFLRIVGNLPSHNLRKLVYRAYGMKIGHRTYIYAGAEIRSPEAIVIGDDCIIGHNAILDGRYGIEIGNNVNLSTGVWIWTMQHDPQSPTFEAVGGKVTIHDNAWVSGRAIILPSISVGEGAVIASGAVVTKDVLPYTMIGGVPARLIGDRSRDIAYRLGDVAPLPFF